MVLVYALVVLGLVGWLAGRTYGFNGGLIPPEELSAEIRANRGQYGIAENWPQWVAVHAALPVSEAWAAPKKKRRRRRATAGAR